MQVNGSKSINRRWPLLFWLGAIFCFVLFPVLLLDIGLQNILETRSELQKNHIYRDLNNQIEKIMQYGDGRHYYHALLKKTCEIASAQKDPIAYLEAAIGHLKLTNPGAFRFIVYDKNGQTIDRLTDEKRFKYIVKTMYEVFAAVTEDARQNYPGTPEKLEVVNSRLNLLRSYLGAFLVPEKLNLPLLRGNRGECIISASEPEKSHFWYTIEEEFGLFVNIHANKVYSIEHLKKLVKGINRQSESIRTGIADMISDQSIYTGTNIDYPEELLIELGKFENISQQNLETENYLLLVRMVGPFVRGFAYVNKADLLIESKQIRVNALMLAGFLIFIFAVIIYHRLFVAHQIISIRTKLALLFIYANGLPLLILGFLGYEYLHQTRRLLLDQSQHQIEQLLTEFDLGYEKIKKEYALRLNSIVDEINKTYGKEPVPAHVFDELVKVAKELKSYDLLIVDQEGQFRRIEVTDQKSMTFAAKMNLNLLRYINETIYTPQHLFEEITDTDSESANSTQTETLVTGNLILLDRILQRIGKIFPERLGAEGRLYYWHVFGDRESRTFNDILSITWNHDRLQDNYLSHSIDKLNNAQDNIKTFAMIETNGTTHPSEIELKNDLGPFFNQIFNLKMANADLINYQGQQYAAFGTIGRQLDQTALIGLFPLGAIDAHINRQRIKLILFAFLSLSLTGGIGSMLSAQFMDPVKELEKGVRAIGKQNFRYRLPIKTADEFSHLSEVFNSALESLEELEIARVVQENLFPQDALIKNRLEIMGRSISMSRLGGDYYDYFTLENHRIGVVMGDVAGHGVPAALIMAMAKSSVLISESEKYVPSQMLATIHKAIARTKSEKIKRMMTCQYLCINSIDGTFDIANAGHCFPILVRNQGKEIEYLSVVGSPLGITKRARYKDETFSIQPGDTLVLYTDGIVESRNSHGKEMGFEGFDTILKTCYSENLETYYQKIFAAYLDFTVEADDDITLVLIKHSTNENEAEQA